MDQFAVHDLFADDFMAAHQPAASVQPVNSHIQNTANHSANNHHSDFSFFNGGVDTGFLQPHSHDFAAVSTLTFATTVNSEISQSSTVETTTESVHFTSQKSGLFSDDHFVPVTSQSVLLHHNHAINQQTLDPFQESNPVKQEVSENEQTIPKEDIKEEIKEELLTEAQVQEIVNMTTINNVVCTFNTRSHLNLRRVAMEGFNVIYKRENNMVNMKLRRPKATASIWSSGKITCTGSESEDGAHKAARRIARCLQKLGFRVRFANYKVVNVLGTCFFPFAVSLNEFSADNRQNASYEPELHPAVTFKLKDPKATLKIFSTGSVTVTAPRVSNIHAALKHVYPLCYAHKLEKTKLNPREIELAQKYLHKTSPIKAELQHHDYAGSAERPDQGQYGAGLRGANAKCGYQQFRYSKRAEEEDSSDDSDSVYGEDSDSD